MPTVRIEYLLTKEQASLRGQNIRALLKTARVECNSPEAAKIAFEFVSPEDMTIREITKSMGNDTHPCAWEVVYIYKPELQRQCGEQNAKEAFENILELIPQNTKAVDKRIIGTSAYKVLYKVISCDCPQLHF